jgi:hypothetical protein
MDWKTVSAKIVQDDQNKWDRKVSGRELQISSSGVLELSNGDSAGKTYSLSEVATSQMCQKLEIPVKYYRRLPDEMKATVANYDINRMNEHSYLVRGKSDWIRAFLSAEYVAYNNSEIADTVQNLLGNDALTMKSFVLEETHMFLKLFQKRFRILNPASKPAS